jgi:putative ABC transport system substrate-binding protein
MRRRQFIKLLGGAATWSFAGHAQPATPVIGFLTPGSPAPWRSAIGAFQNGLREAGYVEGQNVVIEYRFAEGQNDRLPELAADLVRRRVAVIAAVGGPNSPLAAKAISASTPIVFVTGTDPVESRIVTSINRPEANLTGVHMLSTLVGPKRLELLHDLVPATESVAILVNPTRATNQHELPDIQGAAHSLGLLLRVLPVSTDVELDAAFAAIKEQHIGALLVHGDNFFTNRRDQLVLLTTRHAIPTMFAFREYVAAGGLMSYGPSIRAAYSQAGFYVGRILKGAKPSDLPVVQSIKIELVINLNAAKVLDLKVPPTLLAIADEVIE